MSEYRFGYDKDADGIVTITMDLPGPTNLINTVFTDALAAALEQLGAETALGGVILTSAKPAFVAGGDIDALYAMSDPQTTFDAIEQIKALMRRLETLGAPVVAAINGAALGGGLELALACHHRVAIANVAIRLGFPEVTLGLLPGAGGITRTVRLLGLEAALPLLSEGKQISPQRALDLGLVDALANTPEEMIETARQWIRANPEATQPWDQRDYRLPGGTPKSPRIAQRLAVAPAMLARKTFGNYAAPLAILSAAVEGAAVDFDTASRIESRYFTDLATGQESKNMITAFWYQMREITKGGSRPAAVAPIAVTKVGVIGAGLMGHGIAYVTAKAGMPVVLQDVSQAAADAGKARCAALAAGSVKRRRMSEPDAEALLERIHPSAEVTDLGGCDLVIEAVFENREVKGKVIDQAEAQLSDAAVFASNTSTLPITSLAAHSSRPENFIGLHFFSPVPRMRLVEIIRGEATSDETLARAFDFVLAIGKTPIVVNDSRGFYTSRVFATYSREGMMLLAEGHHPAAIEMAGRAAGMPVGPLAVTDEVSLELALHITEQTARDLQQEGGVVDDDAAGEVLETMVRKHGRGGRGKGGGFYDYPEAGPKTLWPELSELFPVARRQIEQQVVIDRLQFVQAIETARCLEEGVIESVADANIGSILGWGFAPFMGGTLQYINDYGVEAFVERSEELARQFGPRFDPPDTLVAMAEDGETF